MGGLDMAAKRYAQLLRDPCNGPLVRPVYSTESSYLIRVESDGVFHNAVGVTGGGGYFCPALLSTSATGTKGSVAFFDSTSDSSAASLQLTLDGRQPGYTFFNGLSNAIRPVAACVQLSYDGAEQLRGGSFGLGQSTWEAFNPAGTPISTTTYALRNNSTVVGRMPPGIAEMRMVPDPSQTQYGDPARTGIFANDTQSPALFWSVTGLPANTGVRVRFVCVYEWRPSNSLGIRSNVGSPASASTIQQVLMSLGDSAKWAIETGGSVAAQALLSMV